MSVKRLSGWFAAAALASAVVSAQQQPPQTPADQKAAPAKQTITVAGCVAKETDVLKRGAGQAAGMGDEFVLTQSVLNPKPATSETPETPAKPDEPTGTSGSSDKIGKVYRVTGDKESELKSYVGQRVEITGSFKQQSDAQREMSPTGTSGAPATAELTTANTPEITIDAIRPASGSCNPVK